MKKYPTVTILVSVKNSERTIKDCVESLLNLDYPNKKIYVVDNMSTDNTYKILKGFGKKIKLERVCGNIPTVYNHALKEIKTKFIALTDADVIVDKNWLKNLIKKFNGNVGAIGGKCITPKGANFLQRLIGYDMDYRFENMQDGEVTRLPTMNLCLRTDILNKIGKFNTKLDVAYDTEIGYRLRKYGYKMLYTKDAIVYHHHRSSLKNYAKQKFKTGTFLPILYFTIPRGLKGDKINPPLMIIQPFLFGCLLLSLFFSIFFDYFIFISIFLFSILFITFAYKTVKLYRYYKTPENVLNFFLYWYWVFFITFGIIFGLIKVFLYKKR